MSPPSSFRRDIKYLALSAIVSIHSWFRRNRAVSLSFTAYIERLMTKALSYLHHIGVLPTDIDFMGHVNNARYLNWVQGAGCRFGALEQACPT
jgi:hypothetical protein